MLIMVQAPGNQSICDTLELSTTLMAQLRNQDTTFDGAPLNTQLHISKRPALLTTSLYIYTYFPSHIPLSTSLHTTTVLPSLLLSL